MSLVSAFLVIIASLVEYEPGDDLVWGVVSRLQTSSMMPVEGLVPDVIE